MLSMHTVSLFFTTSLLLALSPGPDNLFVLTQAGQHGRKAGLMVTLGLCTGLLVHTSAVTLGVAALFAASSLAFTVLKSVGAGYLLYLAWQAFRAGEERSAAVAVEQMKPLALYRRGIIMNITNPKVSIFFLAFLPQFTDPSRGAVSLQMTGLGGIFIVATIVVFGGISLAAGAMGERFRRSERLQKLLNRTAAVIFSGLAVKLVLSQR